MSDGEIVVTGASGALGSGVVRALALSGRRVIAIERDAERARRAFADVANCRVLAFDVSAPDAWTSALAESKIAGAVLVAGTWKGGKRLFEPGADADWSTVMNANLETARITLQALLPGMVAAKSGSVVAIGSRTAARPWEGARSAAYAASKAALVALVQAAAAEVLDDGVRVNALLPSTIDTVANRAAMPKHDPSKWVSIESLSGVVTFLLSDAARDISGAAIPVYGRDGV
ncbi:MAG TPA: SDR family NAD(P)-dependent oxidoreductase [Polyangiaceae bacterium]|jgi:NAD(P)-dependent dehydrogenase (short-subunit alcohol dehydrogenase family)|nr:SDR family NAD(P)-dependent oxidoreductase [Polyangiaceae bacterium]